MNMQKSRIYTFFFLFAGLVSVGAVLGSNAFLELGEVALGIEGGHAARTGRGDSLTVALVLDIARSKDTLDVGLSRAGDGLDVALRVEVKLALDERGSGVVADGVEETVRVNLALLAGLGILRGDSGQERAVTDGLGRGSVEVHGDLGVLEQARGHDLGGTEDITAHKHVHVRGI